VSNYDGIVLDRIATILMLFAFKLIKYYA